MDDEDDPIVASYDVLLTDPSNKDSSNLFVLQYPAHRERTRPYDALHEQNPTSLRLKPDTGFVEVDIPLVTTQHYNYDAAKKFGKTISESRTRSAGGSHGLGGGFSTGPSDPRMRDGLMHDHDTNESGMLDIQTLGGKIVTPSPRDPIYFMRPQLHHIDAEDELAQKKLQSSASTARQKPGLETAAAKVESKPIEVKIKNDKEDAKDRSLNENARLLRDIQVDKWQHHDWVAEEDDEATNMFAQYMHSHSKGGELAKLGSSLSNGQWLDKMSAPREDGKNGLLGKVRGRQRERARRRKAEEEKRQRQREAPGSTRGQSSAMLDMSSESDLTTPEASESEAEDETAEVGTQEIETVTIKEEPNISAAPEATSTTTPKKRGRPRKIQNVED
ncbi:hypothetical protein LTS17_002125 [Exophiala oligosperma]